MRCFSLISRVTHNIGYFISGIGRKFMNEKNLSADRGKRFIIRTIM